MTPLQVALGGHTATVGLLAVGQLVGPAVNLNTPDHYFHAGFILISLANLLVIVAMVVLFCLALLVPFVHSRSSGRGLPSPAGEGGDDKGEAPQQVPPDLAGTWTGGLRRIGMRLLPPAKLLPDSQPAYVASWIYVFGVLTLGSLVIVVLSGIVLAIEGPAWWHVSAVGHLDNSIHLWSVELFMGFMAIHLWGKYWMAAWRGRRQATWITGVIAFLIAIVEAFTGYLSQTNFDSQWIAFESKDAFNASGAGALFNAMNFGQALMLHIVFLPLVLALFVAVHILLVRIRSVVHPIEALPADTQPPGSPPSPAEAQSPESVAVEAGAASSRGERS